MLKESDSVTLRDTPIRLVLKIIVLQLIFSLLYFTVVLISNRYPAFDEGLLWGVITYDVMTFAVLVILQQLITLYWLLRWLTKSYTFTGLRPAWRGLRPARLVVSRLPEVPRA